MEKKRRRRRRGRRPRQPRREAGDRANPLDQAAATLDQALANSPADETEFVWIDSTQSTATSRGQDSDSRPRRETTLFVRVIERGRLGTYRTGAWSGAEIDQAVRQAVAQSRTRDTLQGLPHLPAGEPISAAANGLFDPNVARLDRTGAEKILQTHRGRREVGVLDWGETSVLVRNSRNLRRDARVTHCSLRVRCGKAPGAGHGASSARSLERLNPEAVFERARRVHGHGEAASAPEEKSAVVLAPEATVRLFSMLNRAAFTASAYHDGQSLLREHMGIQVFDRQINLRDDGTDETGLPFYFDLEGSVKRPVDLIVKGTPQTPALDQRQAALLGLQPTGHAVAGNDAQAQNLFLQPGEVANDELLRSADGGIHIGWLERLECFDQPRVRFRAVARGVRRIVDGALGPPLPDLIWEDSLLRALSNLLGMGAEPITWSLEGFIGGISAPSLALADVVGLRPERIL